MTNKLTAKNVDVFYGEKQALKSVSIDIQDKNVTAFIGPSGCGTGRAIGPSTRASRRSSARRALPGMGSWSVMQFSVCVGLHDRSGRRGWEANFLARRGTGRRDSAGAGGAVLWPATGRPRPGARRQRGGRGGGDSADAWRSPDEWLQSGKATSRRLSGHRVRIFLLMTPASRHGCSHRVPNQLVFAKVCVVSHCCRGGYDLARPASPFGPTSSVPARGVKSVVSAG